MGHARALLGLPSGEEQSKLCEEILRRRLSVRQVEAIVQSLQASTGKAKSPTKQPGSRQKEPWLAEIEETLGEALGTAVQIRYTPRRSSITIECAGREEFERVYELLKEADPS